MMYQLVTCGLRKGLLERHELVFEVLESLPVHEDSNSVDQRGTFISSIIKKTFDD